MSSEVNDGMSQWGEMLLEGIWAGFGHMALTMTTKNKKVERHGENLMKSGATVWQKAGFYVGFLMIDYQDEMK